MEALHELLEPKRIGNRVAVDERDSLALRLADSEVPARTPRPSGHIEMDEVVSLLVLLHHVSGRVLAVRIDDDHFEVGPLDHETVQEGRDVLRLIADRGDNTDEQRGS